MFKPVPTASVAAFLVCALLPGHIAPGPALRPAADDLFLSMANSANQAGISHALTTLNISAVEASARNARTGKGGKKTTRAAAKGSTTYKPSAAIRKGNVNDFVARLRRANPQFAATIAPGLTKGDPFAAVAPGLKRYGMRTNDVADAITLYFATVYYGARGEAGDPPEGHARALRDQIRATVGRSAIARASDARKQRAAEPLFLLALLNEALVRRAVADGKEDEMKEAMAQQGRSVLGFDVRQIRLTERGIRR